MKPAAHPLTWPQGWPRARNRQQARFREQTDRGGYVGTKEVSIQTALDRLDLQLDKLGAKDIILSTNRELRVNGQPRGNGSEPVDTGAAVYFRLKGRDTVLACDTWNRVADNVSAIAKHIEALRGMDRWGVGTVEQVFTGYQALPAPEQWWQVLGVASSATVDQINAAWRTKIGAAHPDQGGSDAQAARINAARDAGLQGRR